MYNDRQETTAEVTAVAAVFMTDEVPYLDTKAVARQLNLSERRVRELLEEGKLLRGRKSGRKWQIPRAEGGEYLRRIN